MMHIGRNEATGAEKRNRPPEKRSGLFSREGRRRLVGIWVWKTNRQADKNSPGTLRFAAVPGDSD